MNPEQRAAAYRGWNSRQLDNGLIEVQVVPEIGGRVIQYRLGKKEFLWVSPDLAGKPPTASGLGPEGEWLNYGGDKLWPAPQGWDNEEQWPGPPDAVLDGSPHALEALPGKAGEAAIKLTSREDPRSGIQFIRTVRIFAGTTRVRFDVTMKNIDQRPRRWGIWTVTQVNGARPDDQGHNPLLTAYCPVNPQSHFPGGYKVLFGAPDNPSLQVLPGKEIFCLQYQYKVGKVALDSPTGWTATVDGQDGFVFVQRFNFERGKEYPDGASVEFWSSGLGTLRAWGRDIPMADNPRATPYLVECELLSPFARMQPGESFEWSYEWNAANIGGNYPVVACHELGVASEPLAAKVEGNRLKLTGRFGVFQPGALRAVCFDGDGKLLAETGIQLEVSPLRAVVLDEKSDLPTGARTIALRLHGPEGKLAGELARCRLDH